ncbi:MAG: trimeric intracellular cation channel family protein [Betaproteobacteria bacterium]|nr:MAG: trimeric intracellular cation channel family protein [Betaproteobacteria bacterium]
MKLSALLIAIEVGGTLAFAMSGLVEATRKRMDIVGVFSVAFVSAFGGGTVRDVLLDRRPLFWIQNEAYLWLVLALVVSAPLWLRTLRHKLGGWLMELADAFGLGLFAISGTTIAMAAGMPPLVAILMGAITAVVGGVSRDVLCNEIPKVYRGHQPYTLCALAGCSVLLVMHALGVGEELSSLAGIATATGSRLLSVALDLRLPSWLSTSN